MPGPFFSMKRAMGPSGSVLSKSSISLSPQGRKATFTFCSATTSYPVALKPRLS